MNSGPSFFATPAIHSSDLSPEEWEDRLQQMMNRAEVTAEYEQGLIAPPDFEDALRQYGIPNPYRLDDRWMQVLKWRGQA